MNKLDEIPPIADTEATPLVKSLLAIIHRLLEKNQNLTTNLQLLRDEIAILKGEKAKPKFKPSKMEESTNKDDCKEECEVEGEIEGEIEGKCDGDGQVEVENKAACENEVKRKRAGSAKLSKTVGLAVHEEKVIGLETLPPAGSTFNGYGDYFVQGLKIEACNTRYRLEKWITPDGKLLMAKLPAELQGHHFNPMLRTFVLYQHHHCQVTQPLLREQLLEWDIHISTGQINALLSANKEPFHEEKDEILVTGLEVSSFISVDDSGARHQGKNGYVTQIGNELFAWFASTPSKSRINFLEILHAGSVTYQVNEAALSYMEEQGLTAAVREQLQMQGIVATRSNEAWQLHLEALNITCERHIRIATEGALLGSLLEKGLNPELVIISDGAGQFAILLHALCWIHAERLVHKLIPVNDLQREAVALVRGQIWSLYADLKIYKLQPDNTKISIFEARFTEIFSQHTGYATLDQLLKRLHKRKKELLLVLQYPAIPLHTNGSETDIRDYVKKRKVSGGTRSDLGRQCRDTFASLKKTCRKLGISFWKYLLDRVSLKNDIFPLSTIIRNASISGASP